MKRRATVRRRTTRFKSISNKSVAVTKYLQQRAAQASIAFPIGNPVRDASILMRTPEAIARYMENGMKVIPLEYSLTVTMPLEKNLQKLLNYQMQTGGASSVKTAHKGPTPGQVASLDPDTSVKRTLVMELFFVMDTNVIELSNANLNVTKESIKLKIAGQNPIIHVVNVTPSLISINLRTPIRNGSTGMLTINYSGGRQSIEVENDGRYYFMNPLVYNRSDKPPSPNYVEGSRVYIPCFDDYRLRVPFFVTIGRPQGAMSLSNAPLIASTKITGDKDRSNWVWDTYALCFASNAEQISYLVSDNLKVYTPMLQGTSMRLITEKTADSKYYEETIMPLVPEVLRQTEMLLACPSDPLPTNLVVASGSEFSQMIPKFGVAKLGIIFSSPRDFGTNGLKMANDPIEENYITLSSLCRWQAETWFLMGMSTDNQLTAWLHRALSAVVSKAVLDSLVPNLERNNSMEVLMIEFGLLQDEAIPCEKCIWHPDHSWKYDLELGRAVAVLWTLKKLFTDNVLHRALMQYLVLYWGHTVLSASRFLRALHEVVQTSPKKAILPKDDPQVAMLYREYFSSLDRHVPILIVDRNYDEKTVDLEQEPYRAHEVVHGKDGCTGNPMNITHNKAKLWALPIVATAVDKTPKWTLHEPVTFLKDKTASNVPVNVDSKDILVINPGRATAYCRVNYDEENWARLAKKIGSETAMPERVRAAIYSDAFFFFRNKQIPKEIAQEFANNCANDRSPVCRLIGAMNYETMSSLSTEAGKRELTFKEVLKKTKSDFDHWLGQDVLSSCSLRFLGVKFD